MTTRRFYRFITIAILAFSLISCASKAGSESLTTPVNDAQIGETLAKCEELFRRREDLAKLQAAVKQLAAVRSADARNFEVEWKFAKYSYFLGKQSRDVKESLESFEDGKLAGKIASRLAPEKPDGYFWYAANLGEQAKLSPVTVGVKSVDEIKEAMNQVITLDPRYENASAYDALAQIELSTAGLMGGKAEKAIEYVVQGLKIEANNSYLQLRLAEALLATGKREEAKKQLEFVLKMKANPEYVPEHAKTLEKAQKLLETKF